MLQSPSNGTTESPRTLDIPGLPAVLASPGNDRPPGPFRCPAHSTSILPNLLPRFARSSLARYATDLRSAAKRAPLHLRRGIG